MSRKLLCLLTALIMLTGSVAFATGDYDVIGTFSQYPLVEDGENITLTVSLRIDDSNVTPAEDKWFWKWWTYASGVNFEVEQILASAFAERKSLMLAAATLPDIMLGMGFTTDEIMRYGAGEKLLLSFTPYLNDDVMPNIALLLEEFPIAKANITAADGESYTLPFFYGSTYHGESARAFIDTNRLERIGMDGPPETLDEFVTMLYAFKEDDPNSIPLGGSMQAHDPTHIILNAMGFLGSGGNDGNGVTLRNGQVVIPSGDPLYYEYLKLMNEFYENGIISEDFYTDDITAVNAKMSEGLLGLYPYVPFTVTPDYEDYSHWVSVTPMTSAYNDTKQWLASNKITIGGFAASADTQYPEVICRLADFFYSDFGFIYMWEGPFYNTSDTLGLVPGRYWDIDYEGTGRSRLTNMGIEQGLYEHVYDYIWTQSSGIFAWGNNGIAVQASRNLGFEITWSEYIGTLGIGWLNEADYQYYMNNYKEWATSPPVFNRESTEGQFRGSMYDWISPYEVDGYPFVTYFTEDEANAINDLRTVIQPYIRTETAKFVTGVRSLNEFDQYIAEIERLGFREWEGYYQSMYEAYLKLLG